MKKLMLLLLVSLGQLSAAKLAPVETSGFYKAVDARDVNGLIVAFNTNYVSGKQLKTNALGYIYMNLDIATLNPADQAKIANLIALLPDYWSSNLPITASNRKWLDSVNPAHAKNTRVVGAPAGRAPVSAPVPAPVPPPPDISAEPVYSYEVAKKAWQAHKWQMVLANLQNFEMNPGIFTNKPMAEILAEMVRDTPVMEWNKIAPRTRNGLEKLLKQYGVNPPVKREPPLPPIPAPKPPMPLPPTPQKPPAPKPGPLPPVPGSSDNALIKQASNQIFADAIQTLLKIKNMDSDAFRAALDNLFLKQPPRGSYADSHILILIKGGYPEAEARNEFYDRISNFGAASSQLQKRNRLIVDILLDIEEKNANEG